MSKVGPRKTFSAPNGPQSSRSSNVNRTEWLAGTSRTMILLLSSEFSDMPSNIGVWMYPVKSQHRHKYTNRINIDKDKWINNSLFAWRISFFCKKEEPPVCVACNSTITVKYILIECADLMVVRKKCFEERSLCSLFRNVNPEKRFDFLKEIGMFY